MENNRYRHLPSVDKVLLDQRIVRLLNTFPHDTVVNLIRQQINSAREAITDSNTALSFEEMVHQIIHQAESYTGLSLKSVINATGVILHTNLGRAPLSDDAIHAMEQVARGYSNLELDLETGERGSRADHMSDVLHQITGAEAALIVNNNASGILLALTVLARRKEVIISRGQLIQIGGGFRIPEVMHQSGAYLTEIGTTNCTYIEDYERAITPKTVAIFRAHSSNFALSGFTHDVNINELVVLGKQHNLPVLDDIGSGCLIDMTQFGLKAEPTAQQSITAEASLTFFSADKLLGGPQAGIILGKKELISRLSKHPLMRAIRMDKIRLAGLEATLNHYLKGEALTKIPVLRMIALSLVEIEQRSKYWKKALGDRAEIISGESVVGGGSLPGSTLPTWLVAIKPSKGQKVQDLAYRLRKGNPPVIARVEKNTLLLDLRTVFPEQDKTLEQAVVDILS